MKYTPLESLSAAFKKVKPVRNEFDVFKNNLIELLNSTDNNPLETEQYHKLNAYKFLRSYFGINYFINTKGTIDLVIHNGGNTSPVAVIMEFKRPSNTNMISNHDLNKKALHELLLYYLRERITKKNLEIKYIIATNIHEWFIFDAQEFEKHFSSNERLISEFKKFEEKQLVLNTTNEFYSFIAHPAIEAVKDKLAYTHFDLRDYKQAFDSNNNQNNKKIIELFKILSPEYLLKLSYTNDSNTLDKDFYQELLHVLGLSEIKKQNKKFIVRGKDNNRNRGSLIENTITQLNSHNILNHLSNRNTYGSAYDEQLFNISLELVIIWLNRILFLKLLEAQLVAFNDNNDNYTFLNSDHIHDYDDLDKLFFRVLARRVSERSRDLSEFDNIPYLNSSLFEPTELENNTLFINGLQDRIELPLFRFTILKDTHGKKRKDSINAIDYLFKFLSAYDFSSSGSSEILEEKRSLITASVLGLIFEKINGYKDGSYFTPGYITMFMAREVIRKAIVNKFKEQVDYSHIKSYQGLRNYIINKNISEPQDILHINRIINSIRVCDPAVGSGHYLVSVLNEIIAVKSNLGLLADSEGNVTDKRVSVENDELLIEYKDELFEYNPNNIISAKFQKLLFQEKRTVIENCLFGVDINPNSVQICRLRLWIELLKSAYYKESKNKYVRKLETLPNIDINIKCGNSLLHRFNLDINISKALENTEWTIDDYRESIRKYRNAICKEDKWEMVKLISMIKDNFRAELVNYDPRTVRLRKLKGELERIITQESRVLFEETRKEIHTRKKKQDDYKIKIELLEKEIEDINTNVRHKDALEWRFEFPEVLDDTGTFKGFDVVLGNPPYIQLKKSLHDDSDIKYADLYENCCYQTFKRTSDIYVLFYEVGMNLLRKGGHLIYITSNKWMRAVYGESLRGFFTEQNPQLLIDFAGFKVFEEATADVNILLLEKAENRMKLAAISIERNTFKKGDSLQDCFENNEVELENLSDETWLIGSKAEIALKKKIEEVGKPLKEWGANIHRGVLTGFNKAFIIDEVIRKDLIDQDRRSAEIIKPLLRGRNIERYGYDCKGEYLIGTFPALNVKIDNYPTIRDYLKSFGKRLHQTGETFIDENGDRVNCRKSTDNEWFETQDAIAYYNEFEKEKVVWIELVDDGRFSIVPGGIYTEATTFILTIKRKRYIAGILNSSLINWYFDKICAKSGTGTNRWKEVYVNLIPISPITSTNHQTINEIESLVEIIISTKKVNHTANTSDLESKIDKLVYKLYGLTEEDIKIIMGS